MAAGRLVDALLRCDMACLVTAVMRFRPSGQLLVAVAIRSNRLVGRIDTKRLQGWEERASKTLARASD